MKKQVQLFNSTVKAGFPSPADDFWDKSIDLHTYLISRPESTYLVRASGDSMQGAGIYSDDILIVDKSLEPRNNSIVIASLEQGFTVKRFRKVGRDTFLVPENSNYRPIKVNPNDDFQIFGVVIGVVRKIN